MRVPCITLLCLSDSERGMYSVSVRNAHDYQTNSFYLRKSHAKYYEIAGTNFLTYLIQKS